MDTKQVIEKRKVGDSMMDIEGYITAFCVGDGCLMFGKKTSRLPIFAANITSDHRDYSDHRLGILQSIVSANSYDKVYKNRPNAKPFIYTKTAQHPLFGKLRPYLYDAKGKRIIDDYVLQFVNWEWLAILYQDDGHVEVNKRSNSGRYPVYLNTMSYSIGDNTKLAEAIYGETGLPFDVRHKKQHNGNIHWRLYLKSEYYHDFVYGVAPFIQPSFLYKIR